MPHIGLGHPEMVYASRAAASGQYMPDSSTILNKSGTNTTDAWGAAMLAGVGVGQGFLNSPTQDIEVQFPGNTGTCTVEEYDPVAVGWRVAVSITDALAHVIRAPMGPFRIGASVVAGATAYTMKTVHQSGTP